MRMENLLVRDVERILNGRIYLVRLLFFGSFFLIFSFFVWIVYCGVEMGREWGFFWWYLGSLFSVI